jgi:hypothetical protein
MSVSTCVAIVRRWFSGVLQLLTLVKRTEVDVMNNAIGMDLDMPLTRFRLSQVAYAVRYG